jgi:hypothetical protein
MSVQSHNLVLCHPHPEHLEAVLAWLREHGLDV